MARVTVQMEIDACDACLKKGEQVEATEKLIIGEREWSLCNIHKGKFAAYFVDALGEPGGSE